jgi:hypothetical protein
MTNYKNLSDLISDTNGRQLSLQDILNKRAYFNVDGWKNFDLDHELKIEIVEKVLIILGGWSKNKPYLKSSLMDYYNIPQHWGLSRIFINAKGNFAYCAGQDYVYELKCIRDYLRK